MVITVGRQYGSGGREIGTALANKLGIVYYDDLLLKKAAEESGLCEELFHSFDERPKSFLYSIAMDPYSFSMNHVTPKGSIEQQVYLATYVCILLFIACILFFAVTWIVHFVRKRREEQIMAELIHHYTKDLKPGESRTLEFL